MTIVLDVTKFKCCLDLILMLTLVVLRCPNRNCRARKSLIIQLKFLLFNVLLGQVLLFTAINGQLIMAFLELPHPQPYRHATVNHSQHFVDPQTGVHTNNVEALWSRCKNRFKQMNGTSDNLIPSYIDEFMWRQFYGSTASEAFDNILLHISQRYPI